MGGHYFYWFLQIPAASAVVCWIATDVFARYHLPRFHDRVAICAGFLGGFATLLWQALDQVRRLGRHRPRRDLPSMF